MGSVKKAFKKVVGAVTGKSSAKAPKINVEAPEIQYAPEVENPEENTPEVELGAQETEEQRRRKGKRGLRIDLATSTGGSRGGLNIV